MELNIRNYDDNRIMKIRQPEGSGVAIFAWLLECVQLLMITKAYGQIIRTASTYIILFSGMYYVELHAMDL